MIRPKIKIFSTPRGQSGASSFVYIAYASDASGTGFTTTFNSALDYIAVKTSTTEITSPSVGDFSGLWKNYKGATGSQGIQGEIGLTGSAGADAFVYIAYASDNSGTGFTTTFNASLNYIAVKSSATSLTPVVGDFAGLWFNYKGAQGIQGIQGAAGTGLTNPTATVPAFADLPEATNNGTNKITLTAPSAIASDKVITLPDATDTLVGKDTTDTLTNKTLTSPVIAAITNTDHITITPGTSKLVKLAVLRQDDTTNTYKNNSIILTGWGFITGNGSTVFQEETVTFGITFSETPIVVSNICGAKDNSDPTNLNENTGIVYNATNNAAGSSYSITTTTFKALITRNSVDGNSAPALASIRRYMYSWIAIGVL